MAARKPDDQRILEVYRETIEPLYGFALRRVGGARQLAEDVTQETFLKAVTHWCNKGLPENPLAWLCTVARNIIRDHHRRRPPQPVANEKIEHYLTQEPDESEPAPVNLTWALAHLKRAHSDVLEAFYLDGQSTRDIARTMGVSERAIEGRLRRARQALRRQLERAIPPGGAR